ncbi:unnamed protein product [Urochloa humidicola]
MRCAAGDSPSVGSCIPIRLIHLHERSSKESTSFEIRLPTSLAGTRDKRNGDQLWPRLAKAASMQVAPEDEVRCSEFISTV